MKVYAINSDQLDKIIKKTIKDTVQACENRPKTDKKSYFKKTERLLYSYNRLKLSLQDKKDELAEYEEWGVAEIKRRSKDIIIMSSGSGGSCYTADDYMDDFKATMERTERQVKRIDKALKHVQNEEGFQIIRLKYLQENKMTIDQIASCINVSIPTCNRWKNRIINQLAEILFGADALET